MENVKKRSINQIDMLHKEITDRIIACFYKVYTNLGYGFLEKVYENAMLIELNKNGLKAISQYPIKVNYNGVSVGEYFADIIVEDKVIIELKASANLVPENILQLQNYLKATNIEVGLLLNFGKKPEIRRKTFHNNLKSF
ncbi:MAG TPA: GxxExxY protein [Candidatus Cloacimonas sp.]|nr:GxxExxY protein [Candidatus Cloacimonas sp.]